VILSAPMMELVLDLSKVEPMVEMKVVLRAVLEQFSSL